MVIKTETQIQNSRPVKRLWSEFVDCALRLLLSAVPWCCACPKRTKDAKFMFRGLQHTGTIIINVMANGTCPKPWRPSAAVLHRGARSASCTVTERAKYPNYRIPGPSSASGLLLILALYFKRVYGTWHLEIVGGSH
eukprot:4825504-Pleurochrysis_carterae.AAC.5